MNVALRNSEPHHSGIEIFIDSVVDVVQASQNRTIVELKSDWTPNPKDVPSSEPHHSGIEIIWMSWTVLTLLHSEPHHSGIEMCVCQPILCILHLRTAP